MAGRSAAAATHYAQLDKPSIARHSFRRTEPASRAKSLPPVRNCRAISQIGHDTSLCPFVIAASLQPRRIGRIEPAQGRAPQRDGPERRISPYRRFSAYALARRAAGCRWRTVATCRRRAAMSRSAIFRPPRFRRNPASDRGSVFGVVRPVRFRRIRVGSVRPRSIR
jgi:hypothetical protein